VEHGITGWITQAELLTPSSAFVEFSRDASPPGLQLQISANGELDIRIVQGKAPFVLVAAEFTLAAGDPPLRFTLPAPGFRVQVRRNSAIFATNVEAMITAWGTHAEGGRE